MLVADAGAVGAARGGDRERDQRRGVVALGHVGAGRVHAVGLGERGELVGGLALDAGQRADDLAVDLVADLVDQALAVHAVAEEEAVEGAGVERGLDDADAALVDVAEDHQALGAGGLQRADLGGIVGLAVLVRRR